jgi:hypothetical protein
MKDIKAYAFIIGILALLLAGCSNEKNLLRRQVAAQADSISQCKGILQQKTDSLQNMIIEIGQNKIELDSATREKQLLQNGIGQLNSQVKNLKSVNEDLQTSLEKSLALRDSLTAYYSKTLDDTSRLLANLRTEFSSARDTIVLRDALLEQIQPWYLKWKHDAHRNFLKVLFGSGRAKPPTIPEPDMEAIKGS